MLIPESLELLNSKGLSVNFGTRNEDLKPSLGPSYGVKFDPTKNELTLFTEQMVLDAHLGNLKSNGRVSVGVANPVNHYTNQFKGTFISAEPCSAEEIKYANDFFQSFKDVLLMGFGEQMRPALDNMQIQQCAKVTFKIEEVYDQTPGPGAGKLISQ